MKAWMIFVLVLMPFAAAEEVIEFDFIIHHNDSVMESNARVFLGKLETLRVPESEYQLLIYGRGNEILAASSLPVYFAVADPFTMVNETIATLRLPYGAAYEAVRIQKGGKLMYEQDIRFLCRVDGVCEEEENYASCPGDCASGNSDGLCVRMNDGVCDSDCIVEEPECRGFPWGVLVPATGVAVLLGAVLFWLVLRRAQRRYGR